MKKTFEFLLSLLTSSIVSFLKKTLKFLLSLLTPSIVSFLKKTFKFLLSLLTSFIVTILIYFICKSPDEYFVYIFIFLSLIMLLVYIKSSFMKIFFDFCIIAGLIYFVCEILFNFGSIILNLSNLYFIENNQETESIISIIGGVLLFVIAIRYIPNLINVFKIEKITSMKLNMNQTMRCTILFICFGTMIHQSSLNKNYQDNNLKANFIIDTEIPNSEEIEGKIFIDEEEIPIKIINKNWIETENRNEKFVVNIGNEKLKVMDCTKNDCKNIKKGEIINLKDKKIILFDKKKYIKNQKICENKLIHSLVEKCFESQYYEWITRGNFLKGKILKIEDKYYVSNNNTISTLDNINYIFYPVKKLFFSSIFLIILYFLFKGNKDYYSNQKKEREKKEKLIKFLIGEDVKQYEKDKLEEEIKEIEEIFNFSMVKMFFTIPPLATIVFIIFNFIQKPEINFKMNFNSPFVIASLFVFICTIILLLFIEFILKKIIIENMFLPRNEFFEFKEIILEIVKDSGESLSNV